MFKDKKCELDLIMTREANEKLKKQIAIITNTISEMNNRDATSQINEIKDEFSESKKYDSSIRMSEINSKINSLERDVNELVTYFKSIFTIISKNATVASKYNEIFSLLKEATTNSQIDLVRKIVLNSHDEVLSFEPESVYESNDTLLCEETCDGFYGVKSETKIVKVKIPKDFTKREACKFREMTKNNLDEDPVIYELDFSKCEFIDEGSLSVLIDVYKKRNTKQSNLILKDIKNEVAKVLYINRFIQILCYSVSNEYVNK